jgi:hypothetical protein
MPINYPQFGRLSAQEMGGLGSLDLAGALRSGLQNANLLQETRYKPQQLQQELYAKQLANKINEAKAQYAEQQESMGLKQKEAQINHLAAQTALSQGNLGLIPYYKQLYTAQAQAQEANIAQKKYQMQQEQAFQNLLSGNQPINQNNQFSIPSINKESPQNDAQNTNQRTNNNVQEQVITPGNPNLQNINDIYENYPQYRKKLEDAGYKKKQTVKYDAKTGITNVLTTMPNGEVRSQSYVNESGENSPATTATKTAAQKTITAITNARPVIQKIIEETKEGKAPGQWIGKYFSPNRQAAYESDVIQSSDTLAGALGFPPTDKGIHQAQQTVQKKPLETDTGYVKRLETLLDDINKREKTAQKNLGKGVSLGGSNNITKEQALAELERRRKLRSK